MNEARRPYPPRRDEQAALFQALPEYLARMRRFKVNTGTRDQEVCRLRWDWEVAVPELGTSVFPVTGECVRNRVDRLAVLNRVAESVVDQARGGHKDYGFSCRGNLAFQVSNTGWQTRARKRACPNATVEPTRTYSRRLPEETTGIDTPIFCVWALKPVPFGSPHLRVHDPKHTFGRRLRSVAVPLETRKVLLGHRNGDITTHCSAPELEELIEAANKVCAEKSGTGRAEAQDGRPPGQLSD